MNRYRDKTNAQIISIIKTLKDKGKNKQCQSAIKYLLSRDNLSTKDYFHIIHLSFVVSDRFKNLLLGQILYDRIDLTDDSPESLSIISLLAITFGYAGMKYKTKDLIDRFKKVDQFIAVEREALKFFPGQYSNFLLRNFNWTGILEYFKMHKHNFKLEYDITHAVLARNTAIAAVHCNDTEIYNIAVDFLNYKKYAPDLQERITKYKNYILLYKANKTKSWKKINVSLQRNFDYNNLEDIGYFVQLADYYFLKNNHDESKKIISKLLKTELVERYPHLLVDVLKIKFKLNGTRFSEELFISFSTEINDPKMQNTISQIVLGNRSTIKPLDNLGYISEIKKLRMNKKKYIDLYAGQIVLGQQQLTLSTTLVRLLYSVISASSYGVGLHHLSDFILRDENYTFHELQQRLYAQLKHVRKMGINIIHQDGTLYFPFSDFDDLTILMSDPDQCHPLNRVKGGQKTFRQIDLEDEFFLTQQTASLWCQNWTRENLIAEYKVGKNKFYKIL